VMGLIASAAPAVAFDRLARMPTGQPFATVGSSKAVTPSRCDSTWRGRQRTST
jgi:hypothetical protein